MKIKKNHPPNNIYEGRQLPKKTLFFSSFSLFLLSIFILLEPKIYYYGDLSKLA